MTSRGTSRTKFTVLVADAQHRLFALDSRVNILHSGITSQTSSAAGPAKLMFAMLALPSVLQFS